MLILLTLSPARAYGWGNGSSSSTIYPYYGIHDIIADTAYQKLRDYNATVASWITEYYLNPGGSKWGDYRYSFGQGSDNWLSYTDDPDSHYQDWKNHTYEVHGTQRGSPKRIEQCYDWVVANLTRWILCGRIPRPIPADFYANAPLMLTASEYAHRAAYAAGLLTHYLSDLSQFGHTDYTEKDHSHPFYDPLDSTYHGYYESVSISENLLSKLLNDLGGYTFKVDEMVGNAESLAESFARWINAHEGNSAPYVDKGDGMVIVGSTYRQMLTSFVTNYDAGLMYLGARGYNTTLYDSTLRHISAAVGNITQLFYSAYQEAEERAATIGGGRAATQITFNLASSIKVGELPSPTIALSTENGSGFKGQTVHLSIVDNSTSQVKYPAVLGSVVTNMSGKSGWRYGKSLNAGAYRLVAWYIGNETYSSSYASHVFTVRLISTSLSITVSSTTEGKPTTLKATLNDEDGKPINGAAIDFYVGDTKYGSANTDSKGTASLAFTPSKAGVLQIRARYVGGGSYCGSDSETANLDVPMDYTLYVAVGSMAVFTLIVILLLRRRH